MAMFKTLLESLNESADKTYDDKLLDFYTGTKGLGLSKAKPHRHARTGEIIPDHAEFTADSDHNKIFKHLKNMGYKKTKGFDSTPDEWTSRTNPDTMTWHTDQVHHDKRRTSVRLAQEHGGPMKVIFNTWPKSN